MNVLIDEIRQCLSQASRRVEPDNTGIGVPLSPINPRRRRRRRHETPDS
jgi:hypothetical protein